MISLKPMDRLAVEDGYVFRGQSVQFPSLCPKANRLTTGEDLMFWWLGQRGDLDAVQSHYKRIIHNVQPNVPPDMTWLEWQAMTQHYGGPTRLLDVTTSPMIAAYIACGDVHPEHGAFLWCFGPDDSTVFRVVGDMLDADNEASPDAEASPTPEEQREAASEAYYDALNFPSRLWEGSSAAHELLRKLHEADAKVAEKLAEREDGGPKRNRLDRARVFASYSTVVLVPPYQLNARLPAQQGAFAVVTNHDKGLHAEPCCR